MGGAALEPPAGGGEEWRTWGRKALPPRVFTILKPEKEKKVVGGGGGGGGGGANERSWPINGPIKWLEQKYREINGGHRKRRVCSRRKVKEKNSGLANFRRLKNFQAENYSPAHCDTCKTKD